MFLQVSESQLFVPIGILIVPMYHIQSVASGRSAPPPDLKNYLHLWYSGASLGFEKWVPSFHGISPYIYLKCTFFLKSLGARAPIIPTPTMPLISDCNLQ